MLQTIAAVEGDRYCKVLKIAFTTSNLYAALAYEAASLQVDAGVHPDDVQLLGRNLHDAAQLAMSSIKDMLELGAESLGCPESGIPRLVLSLEKNLETLNNKQSEYNTGVKS